MSLLSGIAPFSPMFIFPSEYAQYGLPNSQQLPEIDSLVQLASEMIDDHCGRTDGSNNGSLVISTYVERIKAQSLNRNIYYLPHRPMIAIDSGDVAALSALTSASGAFGVTGNYFYTGALPSINTLASGSMSAIIGASGRQSYGRRGSYDNNAFGLNAALTSINTISIQNGPSIWIPLDMVNVDYDVNTGEVWFNDVSLFGAYYNEVVITYNSGYDPRYLPKRLKSVCAALTKNIMAKGSGTTGMTNFQSARSAISAQFSANLIDDNLKDALSTFVSVRVQ